ncbi:hypothetical protein CYMTET_21775 [Cymbomonas tetramitiformis]|uniref:Fe2OG dioxygenase domain-containing protein n=1 Tax=Cymbomonas tetramitiformis TaxID=36881 RepID=A0AAE0L2W4_9CHLO|nr:hypothetical protein CYMTET_21775 [Cymbomonas tetramitiformis]
MNEELETESKDPSVLDTFYYFNTQHNGALSMGPHLDPGFFSVTPASLVPGLQVVDQSTQSWVDVEAEAGAGNLVLFCAESLERWSAGKYSATNHQVVTSMQRPRLSVVFELRSHNEGDAFE